MPVDGLFYGKIWAVQQLINKDAGPSANIAAKPDLGGNMDIKDKKPIGVAKSGYSFFVN